MKIDEDIQLALMDAGALGYDDSQVQLALGLSDDEFGKMMDAGGRLLLDQGAAKFRFAVGRKLLEMAAAGDIQALKKVEQSRRVRRR